MVVKRQCAEAECRTLVESPKRKCAKHLKASRQRTSRNAHVKKTYDLSPEDYALLKELSGGACMACGEARSYELAVDHDHHIERHFDTRSSIRGLLCKLDNTILRKAGDSASRLRALADYLDSWPSAQVLGDSVMGSTQDRRR